MRVLFLTMVRVEDVSERGIYTDLMRKLRDEGHEVYIVSPLERRYGKPTSLVKEHGISLLKVRTLNLQKTRNLIEKGLGTVLLDTLYSHAIKRHLPGVRFDLVLYSTPPITFTRTIRTIKEQHGARSYLLLKDIFPQGAVDLGFFQSRGLIHRYFRSVEKSLYAASDRIGCMSPANVEYVREHNPQVDPGIVHLNPNSIEPVEMDMPEEERQRVREKHGLPVRAPIFLYGGNLGKPQGIDFLIRVIESNVRREDLFFVVIGSGTEFPRMRSWFDRERPGRALLLEGLPKNDYDRLVPACDVGMIFLDPRFTIPNFPSRLLSYLECRMPVLAATDTATDMGRIMEQGGFGLWSKSGDLEGINRNIQALAGDPQRRLSMGEAGHKYLLDNYTVEHSYRTIVDGMGLLS